MCGIFLILCWSSFINNFMLKNSFSEPKYQRKLNISRPIYFKKISAHHLVGLICASNPEGFFFWKKFFSRTCSFFHDCNTTNMGVIFFPQKKIVLYFFQEWFFKNVLKTCLKNLFRKTEKMVILLFQISHTNPTSYLNFSPISDWCCL